MKTRAQHEFGDFQTPDELADMLTAAVALYGIAPASLVEPTCGVGSILSAAVRRFPNAFVAHGLEINKDYLTTAKSRLLESPSNLKITLHEADAFKFNWKRFFARLPEPILVIGNPPWVTSSDLGTLNSTNLPVKTNFQKQKGLDAITGKSNFDIAEWMLIHMLEWLEGRDAVLAMLVKTSVARKLLAYAWKVGLGIKDAAMYRFDAKMHFNVAVDACVFVCRRSSRPGPQTCAVADLTEPRKILQTIGCHQQLMLADQQAFQQLSHLWQQEVTPGQYRWRSGIKHDCSKIMELTKSKGEYVNGLGESVDIEENHIYPMMKGSEVAKDILTAPVRAMIVPQIGTGDDTSLIKEDAPKTWAYLCQHGALLDARTSAIYRKRARFSVFGVGKYSFQPWKIAICALYKKLTFSVIGPYEDKPVVFDDTVYHLSFDSESEARKVAAILNSAIARRFFESIIFWDSKRAVTVEVLRQLNLHALGRELGIELTPVDEVASKKIKPRRRKRDEVTIGLF